jgi:RHS repeat-associated protein
VYYGYRYYSPGVGRWVSRDPIENIGLTLSKRIDQSRLYSFNNNQVDRFVDPLGLSPVTIEWVNTTPGYTFVEDTDHLGGHELGRYKVTGIPSGLLQPALKDYGWNEEAECFISICDKKLGEMTPSTKTEYGSYKKKAIGGSGGPPGSPMYPVGGTYYPMSGVPTPLEDGHTFPDVHTTKINIKPCRIARDLLIADGFDPNPNNWNEWFVLKNLWQYVQWPGEPEQTFSYSYFGVKEPGMVPKWKKL